jgi:hypothetical protein
MVRMDASTIASLTTGNGGQARDMTSDRSRDETGG